MKSSFLTDILAEISEKGRRLIRPNREAATPEEISKLADSLLSGRGEASGVAIARQILDSYQVLDADGKRAFFETLAVDFGIDREELDVAARAYLEDGSPEAIATLHAAAEPRRQELIRRLNLAPGGTAALVAMRADLAQLVSEAPALRPVDADFEHLFSSWFNRGFLVLRHIDWDTPASILERIVRYEAVHQIRDWNDLRNRIDRPDRRLYAFFHPNLVDEPLIFVEVALTADMPDAIAPILNRRRTVVDPQNATTATFYSISNCQIGLRGISFGSFLIKQVIEELTREFPALKTFVTLSPVPAFMAWLRREQASETSILTEADREALELLSAPDWEENPAAQEAVKKALLPLAAHFFLRARTGKGRPIDPVARFHLGNGARLERLNWLGDTSQKGMAQSGGLMVNYLYVLKDIEKNHEAYANDGEVVAANAIRKLLRGQPVQTEPISAP
jgi:malonyl-CoA decarboxylase